MSLRARTEEAAARALVVALMPVVLVVTWARCWWHGRMTVRGTLALWLHEWTRRAAQEEVARR